MKQLMALVISVWLVGIAAATAQPDHVSPIALSPPTVSNSSVQVAAPNPRRAGLYVFNPSATVTLWVAPTGTPAAVNGAGSVAIQPLQTVMFGPPKRRPGPTA